MKRILTILLFTAALTAFSQWVLATAAPATQPTTLAATRQSGLTVAILDFSADVPGNENLGKQIGETLTASLSDEPGFTLVDRATLARTLEEHALNLTGIVDSDKAIEVGKLIGAKILITGKAFAMDKSLFITAKIIGTETSLVDGVVVKGKQGDDMGDLVMQLSDKLSKRLRERGPTLIASDNEIDPYPELKKKLAHLKLPKIALEITEQHISVVHAIDPPVDTELKKMLIDCGFAVIDTSETSPAKAGVEVLIKGEGVSEMGARIGNLTTCTGRVELKVVNYADGKTLYADRYTARAVDLSEQIAGKTALQKSAHELGIKILQHFADTLPPGK